MIQSLVPKNGELPQHLLRLPQRVGVHTKAVKLARFNALEHARLL